MSVVDTPPLDLDDIQGDILTGFPKRLETLVFFTINDNVDAFRVQLSQVVPFITTTTQATDTRKDIAEHKANALAEGRDPKTIPAVGVAIAFSQFGITKLGIKDSIQDSSFETGQRNIAEDLGDKVDPNWLPAFKNEVHGVLVVAGDSEATIESTLGDIQRILGTGTDHATIKEVHRVTGNVRPPPQKGHEHFGF
ncbi:hypothetical protein QCA50_007555 [Cerrena zonata]|uniref:DyP dimeric alpha+beta barrel domain-containing protein n=1 Tax=Cerrena zonata TaxID=2478898 RepID=A0AAW0G670_9APHY